jgi:sugar lactone lactonase YvrE
VIALLSTSACVSEGIVGVNHDASVDEADAAVAPSSAVILGAGPAFAVDVHVDEQAVYWATCDEVSHSAEVFRMTLDGRVIVRLLELDQRVYRIAIDDTHVYAAVYGGDLFEKNTGSIVRVPKLGGTVETLAADLTRPYAIAVDDTHVFFGTSNDEAGLHALSRVVKTGGEPELLVPSVPGLVALDLDHVFVYFTEARAGRISRIYKTGGSVQVISSGWTATMDLDVTDDLVFTACWTCDGTISSIYSIERDGDAIQDVGAVGWAGDGDLVAGAKQVFLVSRERGALYAMSRRDGRVITIAQDLAGPVSVTVDPSERFLYWVDYDSGEVGRASVPRDDIEID